MSMKCPKCGQELVPSKKDPECMLCYNCKKKYRVPQKRRVEEQRYSNIPPKHVRDKSEKEMRKAYTDMLSVEEEGRRRKKPRRQEPDDEYYELDDYEDDKVSKAPIIILGIIIIIVAALIVYMLKFR